MEGHAKRWSQGYSEPHVDIRFWPRHNQSSMVKWVVADREGESVVVDVEMRGAGVSRAGVAIAVLLDREREE